LRREKRASRKMHRAGDKGGAERKKRGFAKKVAPV